MIIPSLEYSAGRETSLPYDDRAAAVTVLGLSSVALGGIGCYVENKGVAGRVAGTVLKTAAGVCLAAAVRTHFVGTAA
jgi:hypothetical protein